MRSYALSDLEEMSALSRRTISDYVSKGLLNGPSHRGRGARYSQRDLDALRVIPLVRTLMKEEFPSLGSIRTFLRLLSPSELHQLARLQNELAFEIEVRRLRVLNRLKEFSPATAPERIRDALEVLTPEQIRGVDRGNFQVGSLLDLDWLTDDASPGSPSFSRVNSAGHSSGSGAAVPIEKFAARPAVTAAGDIESDAPEGNWARFGDSTVEIRIDKQALMDRDAHGRISAAIKDFTVRLEEALKEYE